MKIFPFTPEGAEAISEMIRSVRLLENGFFISDGNFGIMYRDGDDIGNEKESLINSVSAEVAKHQKQVLIQEGLIRAYTRMETIDFDRQEKFKAEIDEARILSDKHKALITFVPLAVSTDISKKKARIAEVNKTFQQKKKGAITEDERESLLKEVQTLEAELEPLELEAGKKQAEYDAEATRIKGIVGDAVTYKTEASKGVKDWKEKKELAVLDKQEAETFLETSMALVREVMNSDIDKATGLLVAKK